MEIPSASKIFGRNINSACEKAGQNLLRQAKEEKVKQKESTQKDIYQGAKEIAMECRNKEKGRISFIPSPGYQANYGKINWR